MRPGQEFEATIGDVLGAGFCTARVGERDIRVKGCEPGDRVRARVVERRRGRIDAITVAVLEPGQDRVPPECPHFGSCGGCTRQDLAYSAQLEAKRRIVARAFTENDITLEAPVPAPIAAASTFWYRNKMEYSFGARRWLTPIEIASGETFARDFALGLHVRERHDRVLDVTDCRLQGGVAMRLLVAIRRFARENGLVAWDSEKCTGMLRHLIVRTPAREPEVLVLLVTNDLDRPRLDAFSAMLRGEFPEVTTFLHTVNRGVAQTSAGETTETMFGDGVIHERLSGRRFALGPHSFFQTNTVQAERLIAVATEFAELASTDRAFDLFCGLGTISLAIADRVRSVVGIELDAGAVHLATENAAANGVTNAEFLAGDATALIDVAIERFGRPDVLFIDPPRAGMHPKLVQRLASLAAPRVVYVSCNPRSQAKDLAALCAPGTPYRVTRLQPVDLFPHTDHVENVALLRTLSLAMPPRAPRAG